MKTITDDIFAQVEKEAGVKSKRPFAGFKNTLRFNDGSISINAEVRFAKLDVEPAFSAEGVEKMGPHGGRIRYSRGEWKTYEQLADGTEVEVSDDEIKYYQNVDGQKTEVQPFDATKLWDVNAQRHIEECTLDGAMALGTLIPLEKIDEFGPDKERGKAQVSQATVGRWLPDSSLKYRRLDAPIVPCTGYPETPSR